MFYGFDIDVANEYGVNEAIMIANFQFWINKNKANDKNYYDGHFWTYNSLPAFVELFPFWSIQNIKTILNSLKEKGVIIVGNYNKNKYDRTNWYAFADESKWLKDKKNTKKPQILDKLESTHQKVCTNPPIPDNKPDNKPDDDNNARARAYEHHQQILEKAQPYKEIFLTDFWVTEFIALWNDAAKGRENWRVADMRYIESKAMQEIKKRAKEFYNRYKPNHPEMSEETLAKDLITGIIYRYDNSAVYQGKTDSKFDFSIQNIFTNSKNWYTFLGCGFVQR